MSASRQLDIARRMRREARAQRNDARAIAPREFVNDPLPMAPSQRATLQHGIDFEGGALAYEALSDGRSDLLALSHSSALSPSTRADTGRLGAAALHANDDVPVDSDLSLSSPLRHAIAIIASQGDVDHEGQAEALARIIDTQVEAAVATSPVVASLSQAADAQRSAIQVLQDVRLSLSFSPQQSPSDQDGHSLAQVQGGFTATRSQAAEVQGSSSATPAHSSYSQSDNYGCHRTVFSRSFSVRTLSSFRSCEVSAYFPFRSLASLTDCLLSFFTHCFVVLPFTIFFFLWGECRTCVSQ